MHKQTLFRENSVGSVFLLALAAAALIFLPFLIMDGGLFVYYGDYNVQQIPFYQMCHQMVRSGEMGWNWYTDLGANFVGSYAFYLLGSPFFWLTIPFPNSWVPYLMAPLLMLKMATAAATSFCYIRRFTKNAGYAVLGAMMYAFSGYSIYNVFFNHFHEVIAFFPLLLIGMEEFVVNGRRGTFALAVALNAVVNYYFFFGEVIFVVIYFFFRLTDKEHFRVRFGSFLLLALEAVLGLLMSAVLLLPGLMSIMGNPRTDNFLVGWSGLFYGNVQRYGLILQSLFYPPDIPAYPNFFPDSNAKWSSVSLYLPMMSLSGVIAFCKAKRQHWMKKIFLLSLFIALVPFLNSAFSAFNNAYYARWFFMPLLIMALMSVTALEELPIDDLFSGIGWTAAGVIFFAMVGIFPARREEELVFGTLPNYPERILCYLLVTVVGLILTTCLVRMPRKGRAVKNFTRLAKAAVSFMIVVTSVMMLLLGHGNETTVHRVKEMGLKGEFSFITAEADDYYRIDMYSDGDSRCMDNFPMFWQIPTIQTFHSVVPGSVFTFYESIGVERNVASRPPYTLDGLRTLTSCKYYLCYAGETRDHTIDGFEFLVSENGFDIYENTNFIPMGFTYDYYVDDEAFEDWDIKHRDRLLLEAMYLTDEQIEKYGHILSPLPHNAGPGITAKGLADSAARRRETVCHSFERGKNSFTAAINTDAEELVFFSIPYEEGWTASVNGEPVVIENVSKGLMAVAVPAGESVIRFSYKTPGLLWGALITAGSFAAWGVYLLLVKVICRKKALIFGRRRSAAGEDFRLDGIRLSNDYAASVLQRARQLAQPAGETPAPEDKAETAGASAETSEKQEE
ncbi:MAG: YfhO family protein [Oscillospiraceae bacterium]|nr:YfhO family protein [Oscillospiraceae bacterium]